jgi:hypothetical protein
MQGAYRQEIHPDFQVVVKMAARRRPLTNPIGAISGALARRFTPEQRSARLAKKYYGLGERLGEIETRLSQISSRRPRPSRRRERERLLTEQATAVKRRGKIVAKHERIQSGRPGTFGKIANLGRAVTGRLPTNQPLPEGHTYFPKTVERIRAARVRSAERAAAKAPVLDAQRRERAMFAQRRKDAKLEAAQRKRADKLAAAEAKKAAKAGKPTRMQRISALVKRVNESIQLRQRLWRTREYIKKAVRITKTVRAARTSAEEARRSLQEQIQENTRLLDENERARRENASQAKELRQAKSELERAASESQATKSGNDAVIRGLNSTLAKLEQERMELVGRESELTDKNQRLNEELTEHKRAAVQQRQRAERAEELARKLGEDLARVSESQKEVQRLTGELEKLMAEKRIRDINIETLETERTRVTAELNASSETIAALRTSVHELEGSVEKNSREFAERYGRLELLLAEERKRAGALERTNGGLTNTLQNMRAANGEVERGIVEKKAEIVEARQEVGPGIKQQAVTLSAWINQNRGQLPNFNVALNAITLVTKKLAEGAIPPEQAIRLLDTIKVMEKYVLEKQLNAQQATNGIEGAIRGL